MSVDPVDIEARISKTGQQPPAGPRLTVKDYKGKVDPDWCPGCGDFGVLTALKQALVELNLHPHQVMTISGIGCSSNLPGYLSTYGMHTLAWTRFGSGDRRPTCQSRSQDHRYRG